MKRSLLALLVMAMLMAACSADDTTDDATEEAAEATDDAAEPTDDEPSAETEEAEETEETAEDTEDATEEAAEATEIQMWVAFTDYRLDWARDVATAFTEAHPEIAIDVQGYDDYESLFQATQLAAEQGDAPAIVQYFEVATQEARDAQTANGPLFANLEELIDGRDEILGEPVVLDDVVAPARDYYTLDGQFTSMPWNTSSAIMFSNTTMLAEAGITEPPATWADVDAACEAVAALPEAPTGCITWPNHGWFFEQSLGQQGAVIANGDNGRSERASEVELDSQAAVDFVSWWADMEDAGHYVYTGTQRDWSGTYNAFIAGEVPLLVYSSSDTTILTEDGTAAGFDVVASPMPHNGEVDYAGNLIGGATLWLTNGLETAEQDAALAFLQFFSNPENAADWHKVTGYIPITESAISLLEDEGWFEENPNSRVAGEQLAAADGSVASQGAILGSFVAIRDVVTGAIEDILVNDVDPAERMAAADAEAQTLLDDYTALYAAQ